MFSRKRVFIAGLIGFAMASALGGAAVSFVMLVAARALQGAFGVILAPSALGTLISTFRNPRERGRAFGVFGSVAAADGAVGLILGGVLTQYLSWRYCLYVNLVFAAIAVAGALAFIRSSRSSTRPRMHWPGAVLAGAGLFRIVFGFSQAETAGWTAALTMGSLLLGAVLLGGFVVAERRSRRLLLPLRVILDRTRGGSYVTVFISGIAAHPCGDRGSASAPRLPVPPKVKRRDRLDHDQVRQARRRRPDQPERHPHSLPGAPRPQTARAVDDHRPWPPESSRSAPSSSASLTGRGMRTPSSCVNGTSAGENGRPASGAPVEQNISPTVTRARSPNTCRRVLSQLRAGHEKRSGAHGTLCRRDICPASRRRPPGELSPPREPGQA